MVLLAFRESGREAHEAFTTLSARTAAAIETYAHPLMVEFTQVLIQVEQGDGVAAEQLLPIVDDELWRLAASKLAREALVEFPLGD